MNTFSGKRPREEDMAYLSTSVYMRQKGHIIIGLKISSFFLTQRRLFSPRHTLIY
jgi:hypothetical protein